MIKKAFTIIELIIVVFIIGVLAASVIVSLSGVKPAARNARRNADLQAVAQFINLYSNAGANEDKVPTAEVNAEAGVINYTRNSGENNWDDNYDGLADSLVPTYTNILPTDPKYKAAGDNNRYGYQSYDQDMSTQTWGTTSSYRFVLVATRENEGQGVSPITVSQ